MSECLGGEISAHIIFWKGGSLTWSEDLGAWQYTELKPLIFWYSECLSVWGFCIHDFLTNWHSDLPKGLGIWEFAELNFTWLAAGLVCLISCVASSLIDWYVWWSESLPDWVVLKELLTKCLANWVLYVLFPVQLDVLLADMSEMYYGLWN